MTSEIPMKRDGLIAVVGAVHAVDVIKTNLLLNYSSLLIT